MITEITILNYRGMSYTMKNIPLISLLMSYNPSDAGYMCIAETMLVLHSLLIESSFKEICSRLVDKEYTTVRLKYESDITGLQEYEVIFNNQGIVLERYNNVTINEGLANQKYKSSLDSSYPIADVLDSIFIFDLADGDHVDNILKAVMSNTAQVSYCEFVIQFFSQMGIEISRIYYDTDLDDIVVEHKFTYVKTACSDDEHIMNLVLLSYITFLVLFNTGIYFVKGYDMGLDLPDSVKYLIEFYTTQTNLKSANIKYNHLFFTSNHTELNHVESLTPDIDDTLYDIPHQKIKINNGEFQFDTKPFLTAWKNKTP